MQFYMIRFNKVCGKKQVYNFTLDTKSFCFKYVSNFLFYPLRSNKTIVQLYIVNLQPTKSKHVCVILHYNLHPTKSKHMCVILHYSLHTCVQFYIWLCTVTFYTDTSQFYTDTSQ